MNKNSELNQLKVDECWRELAGKKQARVTIIEIISKVETLSQNFIL